MEQQCMMKAKNTIFLKLTGPTGLGDQMKEAERKPCKAQT